MQVVAPLVARILAHLPQGLLELLAALVELLALLETELLEALPVVLDGDLVFLRLRLRGAT